MSISLTAPRFTDEDERREVESMTSAEKSDMDRDIGAVSSSPTSLARIKESDMRSFSEALVRIPEYEKAAYEIAVRDFPGLVESETPLAYMLAASNFDAEVS